MSLLWTQAMAWYHGTDHEFAPGDYVEPPYETGVVPRSHPDIDPGEFNNEHYVYLAKDPDVAHAFAHDRAYDSGRPPMAYEVEPESEPEEDPENEYSGESGYRTNRARVIRKVR